MTRTGSGRSPVKKERGQTSHQGGTARTQSASAHIFTERVIWLNGSSTRSSNVAASPPATTSSQPIILPSSSLRPFGFGYVLMSPRPRKAAIGGLLVLGEESPGPGFDIYSVCYSGNLRPSSTSWPFSGETRRRLSLIPLCGRDASCGSAYLRRLRGNRPWSLF
jgi:hypothetical protein